IQARIERRGIRIAEIPAAIWWSRTKDPSGLITILSPLRRRINRRRPIGAVGLGRRAVHQRSMDRTCRPYPTSAVGQPVAVNPQHPGQGSKLVRRRLLLAAQQAVDGGPSLAGLLGDLGLGRTGGPDRLAQSGRK